MLDVTLDYRTVKHPFNPTSHGGACSDCQNVVRHNHIAPWGIPRFHIVGTEAMHEVIIMGGRGSHVTHATPACTCKHGAIQRALGKPAACYHIESALILLARWFDGAEKPLVSSPFDLWDGDELDDVADASEMVVKSAAVAPAKPARTLESIWEGYE